MDDINPFWFFFLAWHGILLGPDLDSHSTIVTYMSDGQLTIMTEPMTPPPNITGNSAFRMELEIVEEEPSRVDSRMD
ncbi:hypothetical protein PRIPAC_88934 [Pristionchus pacificus]|uniref:Uncharacterized protein n=1 Tax=Pristionchus pacificus TaxID=54126 RepID=A0A2A6B6F1_PRIPA|nr:hypothetical protein PRIPAC_88934 [Pristionchus pacificus]|eukprot:PDM61431.1 hypothetical protein PRIPAC_50873 [Pristionchus pacificus]